MMRRRGLWILVAVGAAAAVVVVVVVVRRSGPANEFSAKNCKTVLPGGTRFRSSLPSGLPTPPESRTTAGAIPRPGFRPGPTEAVYCADFADPFVVAGKSSLLRGPSYFAYATNVPGANVPVLVSGGGRETARAGDALPKLPVWSDPGAVWAPEALHRAGFVLYYTTTDRSSGRQCISRALGAAAGGPFTDDSTSPMVCPVELGGAIDPSPFVTDDGHAFLLWKNDGNCCGVPVRIWTQPLSEDGLNLTGAPVELITSDQAWEGGVVEGPSMLEHDGKTYLFYSANAWNSSAYAIGYAVCDAPTGPCRKPTSRPWLGSSPEAQGPGGEAFFTNRRGSLRMVFHAWIGGKVGYPAGGFRNLFAVGIGFRAGLPITTS